VNLLLARRIGATALEIAVLSAFSTAALFWDAQTDGLYGWNPVQVGFWLLFLLLVVLSAIPSQPLSYQLFRIRLQRIDGQAASVFHRFTRCLLFWVLLTAPGSLNPDLLFDHLPISGREKLLGSFAVVIALVISPAVSTIVSNGQMSIGDLLTQTTVHTQKRGITREFTSKAYRIRFGVSVGLATLTLSLVSILLVDWRYRISDRTDAYLQQRHLFFEEIAKAADTQSNQFADQIWQRHPSDIYWSPNKKAYLLGVTESFQFRVPRSVLSDPRALLAAFNLWITPVLSIVAPSTEWVELEFYNERSFGPAKLEQSLSLLYNRLDGSLHYAPVDQRFVYGHTSMRLDERLERTTTPDSTITYFERRVQKGITIKFVTSDWAFPRLDLIAQPPAAPAHFLGQT
jgi:hypothetical protein